ncbi:hypothetical protein D3C86_1365470 [compost metagenome]
MIVRRGSAVVGDGTDILAAIVIGDLHPQHYATPIRGDHDVVELLACNGLAAVRVDIAHPFADFILVEGAGRLDKFRVVDRGVPFRRAGVQFSFLRLAHQVSSIGDEGLAGLGIILLQIALRVERACTRITHYPPKLLAWVFALGYSLPARLDDRQVLLLEHLLVSQIFLPLVLLLLASLLCRGTPLSSASARLGRFHLALGEGELSIKSSISQLIAPLAVLQLPLVALVCHLLPLLLVLPHGIPQAH